MRKGKVGVWSWCLPMSSALLAFSLVNVRFWGLGVSEQYRRMSTDRQRAAQTQLSHQMADYTCSAKKVKAAQFYSLDPDPSSLTLVGAVERTSCLQGAH